MRNFINLIEDSNDGDDFGDREHHVEQMIRFAFDKLGLTINHNSYAVQYDASSRAAEVTLEDQEVSLSQLARLAETGLAQDNSLSGFTIHWTSNALMIAFAVSVDLDQATISQ